MPGLMLLAGIASVVAMYFFFVFGLTVVESNCSNSPKYRSRWRSEVDIFLFELQLRSNEATDVGS